MTSVRNAFVVAAALMGVSAIATSAEAAVVVIETNFTANASGVTVASTPSNDLVTATSISAVSWTVGTVSVGLGGLASGDPIAIGNPILANIGATITLSWDGGLYSDTLTVPSTGISLGVNSLSITADGVLSGPGVPVDNSSQLALSFTQSFGRTFLISGSATYVDISPVPEASTWAMLGLGFAGIGFIGLNRRKNARYAF